MSRSTSHSPRSSKRIKLGSDDEDVPSTSKVTDEGDGDGEELDGDHCSICLQLLLDRTVIPECSHEFCFECIVTWTEQSRRCPLCTRTIGPYLIHNIRSNYDYQKYHLPPLISSPPSIQPLRSSRRSSVRRRPGQERRWGRRERREQDAVDELERAIDRRRWVYQNHLFAKHVGSNTFTRYRPFPTPAQFAASKDYISRTTIFVRRELRVWVNLDVEFLTTFILSLMKAIDVRSESAVKLLAEFLDMDRPYSEGGRFPNAEHFAHELYSFIRSPYRTLSAYDVNVQYDDPKHTRRDSKFDRMSTTEKPTDDEVTHHRSRGEPRDTKWSPLYDGGDHFRPKLNGQVIDRDVDRRSPVPRRAKDAEDSPRDSNVFSSDLHIKAWPNKQSEAGASRTTDEESRDSHTTNLNEHPAPSLQMNLKGKQRASVVDDLEVRITDGHRTYYVYQEANEPSRIDPKEETRRSPYNASEPIGTGERPIHRRSDGSNTEEANRESAYPMQKQLRSRNPLHIAQAHLSEFGTHAKLKKRHHPSATEEDFRPNLRVASQLDGARLSLSSRLSDPNQPKAETGETTHTLPQTDSDVPSDRGKYVRPVNDELRSKLAQRLEAERVALAVHERNADDMRETSYSRPTRELSPFQASSPSTSNTGDASGPAEGFDLLDLEVQSRARARLSMKLAVEKHLQATRTRPRKPEDSVLEENVRVAESREGMLRAVLENRRRSG